MKVGREEGRKEESGDEGEKESKGGKEGDGRRNDQKKDGRKEEIERGRMDTSILKRRCLTLCCYILYGELFVRDSCNIVFNVYRRYSVQSAN